MDPTSPPVAPDELAPPPIRICDLCGRAIAPGTTRYVARIEVSAAVEPLVITAEDLQRDHRGTIDALTEECARQSEEDLMKDVYVRFDFDFCRSCQRAYIAAPLGPRPPAV